jgi:hypothetical protein
MNTSEYTAHDDALTAAYAKNAARNDDALDDRTIAGRVSFAEVLAVIDAKQAAKLEALNATLPPCPQVPKLEEEPSELVVKETAFGGKWVRRKYANGTLSHAAFMGKGIAGPRYTNEAEVYAAREKEREWVNAKNAAVAKLNFISGHARGLLNGTDTRSGGYRDFGSRTLATIRQKAQGSSHTAGYCQEIINAYDAQ